MEQQISTHPLKCGWAVLPLPKLVHFPAHWQFTLFLLFFYMENGVAFHFSHGKGTFSFVKNPVSDFERLKEVVKGYKRTKGA